MYVAVSPTPVPVVLTTPFSGSGKPGHWTARINYMANDCNRVSTFCHFVSNDALNVIFQASKSFSE